MEDFEFDIGGAPVVFSNKKPMPYNPLNRPKISYKKSLLCTVGFLCLIVISVVTSKLMYKAFLYNYIPLSEKNFIPIFTFVISFIYFVIFIKRALIWLVHVYQHYAPDRVRLKCVFEPSCSEYMILSIEKYGVIRGVAKGCLRLLRCHPPNGGKDEP